MIPLDGGRDPNQLHPLWVVLIVAAVLGLFAAALAFAHHHG